MGPPSQVIQDSFTSPKSHLGFICSTVSLEFLDPLTGLSCVCVYGCSVESDSFRPHGLQPTRLLCPWDFSRQEYWRGLPFPPSEDLPHPGIEPVFPTSLVSPTLASRFFTTAPPGKLCPNYSFPLSRTAYK